jgi:PAS domain S-box-containing protein
MRTYHVMIFDEDPKARDYTSRILKELGHRVISAQGLPEKGLQKVGDVQPDIALVDLDSLKPLKNLAAAQRVYYDYEVPVVLISASSQALLQATDKDESFACLLKPADPACLQAAMQMTIDRYRSERLLRQSEATFRATFASANAGIALVGLDGRFQKVNHRFCGILGYSVAELLGRTFADITHPADLEKSQENVRSMLAGEIKRSALEKRYIHKNGRAVWAEVAISLVEDPHGEPLYFVTHLQDITARKEAEEELRNTSRKLEERLKELSCLYSIAKLMDDPELSQESLLAKVAGLLPPSWQYPEKACARIISDGREYVSGPFQDTPWKMASEIKAGGMSAGLVEVCYLEPRPEGPEGLFRQDERLLLDAVAERLGNYLQRVATEREIARYRGQLEELVSERTKELQASRQNLMEAQRLANLGSFEEDLASGGMLWSDEHYRILGYETGEIIPDGGLLLEHVHPGDRERFTRDMKAAREEGAPWEGKYRLIKKDGSAGHIKLVGRLAAGDGGRAPKLQGVVQDITRRMRAEAAVQKRAEELADLHALAMEVGSSLSVEKVAQAGVSHVAKIIGPDTVKLFLRRGDELKLAASCFSVAGLDHADTPIHRMGQCLCGQAALQGEPMYAVDIEGDSRCTWGECKEAGLTSAAALPLKSGDQVIGLMLLASGDCRDFQSQDEYLQTLCAEISIGLQNALLYQEQRQYSRQLQNNLAQLELAREQITASKTRLQSVFDGIAEPLIMLDSQARVQMLNMAAAQYYNVDPRHVVGRVCHQSMVANPELCRKCEVLSHVATRQPVTFERQSFMHPGRLEEVVVYPLGKSEKKEQAGIIVRISDITEARIMERQLRQNEKMASLGLLVSGIAHEINNPNNFITFNIPILRDYLQELIPIVDDYMEGRADAEIMGMSYPELRSDLFTLLDNIQHGSSRINSTVSGLQEFSRAKDCSEKKPVRLGDVVDRALALCRSKIKGLVKSFEIDLPESLPMVETAPDAVEQILINLLINAAQASDKDDAWLRLAVRADEANPERIIIEVSDNGQGMSEETRQRIFDPFFTTKAPGEGTGLGLYVCHNLAESLGASLEVDSSPGQGTTFRLGLNRS